MSFLIDVIPKRGVVLNNMYSLPICSPSRAALLTGKSYSVSNSLYDMTSYNIPTSLLSETAKRFFIVPLISWF